MRLVRLSLLNFRQHANTEIEFRPGLTGIIGPNGAGKSTILEAIGWAIYGSAAARGTNDTIRFSRAPGRSRVQVELVFDLAGHEYRVVRTLNSRSAEHTSELQSRENLVCRRLLEEKKTLNTKHEYPIR